MSHLFPALTTPIQSWLTMASELLPDSPSAKLDMEVLLCHVLQVNRTYLYTWPEKSLTEAQYSKLTGLLRERQQGHPVAHLTGVREFWSLPFKVSPTTLIPRPDTEVLIEWILDRYAEKSLLSVLDLGTGTGAIALALAYEKPQWSVVACDRVSEAVQLARENAEALGLQRVTVVESDWFSALGQASFDLIVSNPPYIPASDPHLSEGDVVFEPSSALVSGEDGLQDIRKIVSESRRHLAEQGCLIIEHGYDQAEAVQAIFTAQGFVKVASGKDYGSQDRFTFGWVYGEEHG
ncbi:peptide chain release factor N(5)-glutamine methyltransferase [Litoribacillus peritrichatus]|uniref:Release factor glutamine methyltransferase n=1 Tax=Litoribacillus peritrichatus TaxID=718191 RepID=A0ABP7MGZ4_9GAMM